MINNIADYIIQTANIHGACSISEASKNDDGPFWILVSLTYHDKSSLHDLVHDENWEAVEFKTYAEAKAWIEEAKKNDYVLAHNETGRPSHKIIRAV